MENYSKRLDIYEYDRWNKEVRAFLIKNDLTMQDIAYNTGYSIKTVYDSFNSYERCSRFFVAAVKDWMEEYEQVN